MCFVGNEPVFQDKKVLLLEAESKKNHETLPENYANRVSALSLATKELLSSKFRRHFICIYLLRYG